MSDRGETDNCVLIVEDEAIVAMDIQTQLEQLGYRVVGRALSAADACEKANVLDPDLVLMDIRLKGQGDGIEAASRIRCERGTPVVFLTAYADDAMLERAKAAEPYGYVAKPFNGRDVHTTLQIALDRSRRDRLAHKRSAMLEALVNAQEQGVVMLERNGRVSYMNEAAQRIFQCDRNEGGSWQDVLPLSRQTQTAVRAIMGQHECDRKRVVARLESPRAAALVEIEVRDDPRNLGGRVLLVHDWSAERVDEPLAHNVARLGALIGVSPAMLSVMQQIRDLAPSDATVMIEGETGTGKELVARAIHELSPRKRMPFVALNCAGLSEALAISQLFGHRKGAFTGAESDQLGLFEAADGGTLFLDEIGELSARVQTMLLRVLEERAVLRLGEAFVRPVNTRILVATNRTLMDEVGANRFRSDLFYRLRVARIALQPLRDRRADIPILARHFIGLLTAGSGKQAYCFSTRALEALENYGWPGNVRELRNCIEFALLRAKRLEIQPSDLPPEIFQADACSSEDHIDEVDEERTRIIEALRQCRGNRQQAAQLLGISRATLYRRFAQFGIDD